MIENLKGIHETVNYKKDTTLRLYINDEYENYPQHWHTEVEILCPLENGYTAVCNQVGYRLKVGDILLICPGTVHELISVPVGKRIIFQFDPGAISGIREVETALSFMPPATLINRKPHPLIYQKVYDHLLEIANLYQNMQLLTETEIYSHVLGMLTLLGREFCTSNTPEKRNAIYSRSNEQLLSICNYISAHCAEPLTLDDVSALAGFSKYHFERLFKEFTGLSFYQYLLQKRIHLAERLLIDSSIGITEIAYKSGFTSSTAFSRAFKQAKNFSPSEYRKLHDRYKPEEMPDTF